MFVAIAIARYVNDLFAVIAIARLERVTKSVAISVKR